MPRMIMAKTLCLRREKSTGVFKDTEKRTDYLKKIYINIDKIEFVADASLEDLDPQARGFMEENNIKKIFEVRPGNNTFICAGSYFDFMCEIEKIKAGRSD